MYIQSGFSECNFDLCVSVCNFGQEWEVSELSTKTPYRAGLGEEIHAHIGVKISLRSINITLKGIYNKTISSCTSNMNQFSCSSSLHFIQIFIGRDTVKINPRDMFFNITKDVNYIIDNNIIKWPPFKCNFTKPRYTCRALS